MNEWMHQWGDELIKQCSGQGCIDWGQPLLQWPFRQFHFLLYKLSRELIFFGWLRKAWQRLWSSYSRPGGTYLGPIWSSKAGLPPLFPLCLNLTYLCISPEGKFAAVECVSPGGNPFGQLATFYLFTFFPSSLSSSYFWWSTALGREAWLWIQDGKELWRSLAQTKGPLP